MFELHSTMQMRAWRIRQMQVEHISTDVIVNILKCVSVFFFFAKSVCSDRIHRVVCIHSFKAYYLPPLSKHILNYKLITQSLQLL